LSVVGLLVAVLLVAVVYIAAALLLPAPLPLLCALVALILLLAGYGPKVR
jgi:hypothetical protein